MVQCSILYFGNFLQHFITLKAFKVFGVELDGQPLAWKIHQCWFNFCGSVAGWIALWFLTRKAYWCVLENCPAQIGLGDVFLFLLAFIGVTGHLPYTIAGLIRDIRDLAIKVFGLGK